MMNKPHTTVLSQLSFIIFYHCQYTIDSNLLPYLIHNCVVSSFQFLFSFSNGPFFFFQMKSYINIKNKKVCAMEVEQWA